MSENEVGINVFTKGISTVIGMADTRHIIIWELQTIKPGALTFWQNGFYISMYSIGVLRVKLFYTIF